MAHVSTQPHRALGWQRYGEMYPAKYMFTVDYTNNEIADDPVQHTEPWMELLTLVSGLAILQFYLPIVRVTHPAWFETGEGAPDFRPSQHIHYSKSDLDYTLDVNQVFDNLYADKEKGEDEVQDESHGLQSWWQMKAKGYKAGGKKKPVRRAGRLLQMKKAPEGKQDSKAPEEVRNKMGYMSKGGMMKSKATLKVALKTKGYAKGGVAGGKKKKQKVRGAGIAVGAYVQRRCDETQCQAAR